MTKTSTLTLTLIGAAIALAAALAHWPPSPASALDATLLIDIAIVGAAGAALAIAARNKKTEKAAAGLWLACGALLGAAAAAPIKVALWLLPGVLAFGAAGILAGLGGARGVLWRVSLYVVAAIANFFFLWSSLVGEHAWLDPAEFAVRDFRVNEFLSDVPLHDVWVFQLDGGEPGLTLADAREMLASRSPLEASTIVAGLVGIRFLLGAVFRWDDEKYFDTSTSYAQRLTEADRSASLTEPGTDSEMFQTIYTFENESLAEMMNRTAHAFFCMAFEPAADGYRMYWAIYVRETSRLTPFYMALIDPFRRYIVYPAIVTAVEREWAAHWGESAASPS
jgi:hypothetical protein